MIYRMDVPTRETATPEQLARGEYEVDGVMGGQGRSPEKIIAETEASCFLVLVLMLFLLTATVMFPGMITGSSTAAVLSTGALVAPVLLLMGIPKEKAGAIISIGAIMGMAAPPVNIPAMLICAGVDIPYTGFAGPLFLLTVPCALILPAAGPTRRPTALWRAAAWSTLPST